MRCFVVLEGGEGVGKTTQWAAIRARLEAAGHTVVAIREPGGTPAGDVLRSVLLDPAAAVAPTTEALLFAASRAQLVASVVTPALERNEVVLVDRFLLSTYAYQGAGRGIPMDTLRMVNEFATGGLAPDLTLLLTLPLDAALSRVHARGGADRMEQEERAFHLRVHEAFLNAARKEWQVQHPEIGQVTTIDATGSEHDVLQRCLAQLASRWPDRFGTLLHAEVAVG